MTPDRRLSPIPNSDDQGSEYGAEVSDIPFYRPAVSTPKKGSLSKIAADVPRTAPQIRELEALVPDHTPVILHAPTRSR
jgi:hypothetical protein